MVGINDLFVDPNDPETLPPEESPPVDQSESPEPEIDQSKPGIGDRIRDLRDRFRPKKADQAKEGLRGVEKKRLQGAGRKVATQGGKQVGKELEKKALKQGVKSAVTAASTAGAAETAGVSLLAGLAVNAGMWLGEKAWKNRYYVVGIIAFLLLMPAMIFGLLGLRQVPQTPSTDLDRSQALLASAVAGGTLQQKIITKNSIGVERTRYQTISKLVATNSGGISQAEAQTKITAVNQLLDQIDKASNAGDRATTKLLLPQLLSTEQLLESKLPFGDWITAEAKNALNKPSGNFCKITGAGERVGCASVVSIILNNAGVPIKPEASTINIWDEPFLTTVVSPLPNHGLDKNRGQQYLNQLKPGDIVWWGNGIKDGKLIYNGALFNHVGIYIGDDQAIANSSENHKVEQGKLNRSQGFNGAKRYAP